MNRSWWLVAGVFCVIALSAMNQARAMGISSSEFNFSVVPGTNSSEHFRLTPSLNGTYTLFTSSAFPIIINKTYSLNTYVDIDFTVQVPADVYAGEYGNNYIFISGINETAQIRIRTTVLPSVSLACPAGNITRDVSSDLSDYVPVVMTNTGNQEFICDAFIDGIPMLKTSNQTFLPFSTKKFDIYYAPDGRIGSFKSNFTCRGINFTVPVYLNSLDKTLPMLYNIDFSEDMVAGQDYKIIIWATDNVNVSQVWAELDGNRIVSSDFGDHYEVVINNNETGIRVLAIKVNDTSGNLKTYSKRLRVSPYEGAKTYNLSYIQIKQGIETKKVVFETEKPLEITLNMRNFSYLDDYGTNLYANSTSYVLYFIDQDNRRYDPLMDKPFGISSLKRLYIVFSGAISGVVSGQFDITVPTWVQKPGSIGANTRVGAFSAIESYTGQINKFPFQCSANYAEDFANSTYSCCTTQSIFEVGDPKDIAILLTRSQHDLIFSTYEKDRNEAVVKADETAFQRNIFMALCVIIAGGMVVFYIYKKKGLIFAWG